MDPCPFVRVMVGNLAIKIPVASRPAKSGVHPSSAPCFCKIRLNKLPYQRVTVPLVADETSHLSSDQTLTLAAVFDLSRSDIEKLAGRTLFTRRRPVIKVAVYSGRMGATCGVKSGRLLGRVAVPLDLRGTEERPRVFHNEWVFLGKETKDGAPPAQVHLTVRSEPDPRFVFEFDGEPECSPQVFQVQGTMRQPMFTCKFSCRSPSSSMTSRSWLGSFGSERERHGKERKGWAVTVHDLSGSPVALASMVTPFVACPGSDRVNRSNPGGWLVLRPGDGTWKPWGKLEAWRVHGGTSRDELGCRFELLPDTNMGSVGVQLAESTLSTCKGGKFTIDLTGNNGGGPIGRSGTGSRSASPGCSPRCGSGRYGYSLWPIHSYSGFVMSTKVDGEGKSSRPVVEIGVQNVGCAEDAAAFVALAAAVDLCMDACMLFSHKLRRELSQPRDLLL